MRVWLLAAPRSHSNASCDVEYRPGERAQVILYPAQAAPRAVDGERG